MKKVSSLLLLLLMILIFVILNNTVLAATYYVKDNGCSDSNSGGEFSPWCHCPGMAGWEGGATLNPGDIVYFDKGGTWASSSTDVLNVKGGVQYLGDTWGSGTRAIFRATGTLDYGVVRITSDHPTYVIVVKGFEINANGQYADGVNINRSGWSVALNGATKRVQNCIIHNVLSNAGAGQYHYGIMVAPQNSSTGVSNVEILDNTVYNIGRGAIMLYPGGNNTYVLTNVTVRGNETYSTGQEGSGLGQGCIVKNHVENVIIEFNYFHGDNGTNGCALQINNDISGGTGPSGIIVRYNILENTNGNGFFVQNYGVGRSLDFYGNIVMNSGNGYGIRITGNNTGSLNFRFYNNTFYNNYVQIENYPATTVGMEFKNNIIYTLAGQTPLSDSAAKITTHNNNTYYRVGGRTLVSSGGSSYTSSNLATYEATGLSSDPLLANTSNLPTGFVGTYGVDKQPNTDGLSLQSSSPGKDSGADLGTPYNNSIDSISRPYGAGWDRGAYEVGIYDVTPPSPPAALAVLE